MEPAVDGEISTAQVEVRSTVALAAAGYGTAVAMAAVEYRECQKDEALVFLTADYHPCNGETSRGNPVDLD